MFQLPPTDLSDGMQVKQMYEKTISANLREVKERFNHNITLVSTDNGHVLHLS